MQASNKYDEHNRRRDEIYGKPGPDDFVPIISEAFYDRMEKEGLLKGIQYCYVSRYLRACESCSKGITIMYQVQDNYAKH